MRFLKRGGLPVYGGMATMPTRLQTLPGAVASVLPQVDRLYVYLDGFAEAPACIRGDERITAIPSTAAPGLHASGKFIALTQTRESFLFAGLDDDIAYAPGYVANLSSCLRFYSYSVLLGAHGVVLPKEISRYAKGRTVFHFTESLKDDRLVDIVGTGTCMFHSDVLKFDPHSWSHVNACDLHLAIEAQRQRIAVVCNARPANMLIPLEENQPDSLYCAVSKDDSAETALARELQSLKRTAKSRLSLPSLVPLRIAIARAKRRIVRKQHPHQRQTSPDEEKIGADWSAGK